MKNLRLGLLAVAAMPLLAQNTVFVAGTGTDSGSCTNAAPCRTFAFAYTKAGSGGTILALDSADFGGGTLTITSPVTIDGGGHGAFIVGFSNGIAVFISLTGPGAVVMRNLTIIDPPGGTAFDMTLSSGALFRMDGVHIIGAGSQSQGIIGFLDATSRADIRGSTVYGGGNGINLAYNPGGSGPYQVTMQDVTVQTALKAVSIVDGAGTITDSSFGSSLFGLYLSEGNATSSWLLEHDKFTNNSTAGLFVDGGVTARLSNSLVSGNSTGVSGSGTTISLRNNVFAQNATDGSPLLSTSFK